jgi:hypothetical protein
MRTNELSRKERIDRQAQREAFSFGVCPNGIVNVQNNSYGNDAGVHTYSVDPVSGQKSELVDNGCSCKAAKYHAVNGLCKHQLAVRANEAVMLAAETAYATTETGQSTDRNGTETGVPAVALATDSGQLIEAGDEGAILDEDDATEEHDAFTYHTEPIEQGGKEYARCTDCKREILTSIGEDKLDHADGCSHADIIETEVA